MTDELMAAIDKAMTLVEVEDIYMPYKQKRKTRASVAREKGLEPLAELILAQENAEPISKRKPKALSTRKRSLPIKMPAYKGLWISSPRIFPITQS